MNSVFCITEYVLSILVTGHAQKLSPIRCVFGKYYFGVLGQWKKLCR